MDCGNLESEVILQLEDTEGKLHNCSMPIADYNQIIAGG